MSKNQTFCLIFCLYLGASLVQAQNDTSKQVFNKRRLTTVLTTESLIYSGAMIGLNELWYKDYPRSSFHFFNDNNEWMQMDKVGHIYSSYYVGKLGMDALSWSGVSRKKVIWYGGMLGSFFLSTIEVLDAFSSEWGFSVGDIAANTLGSAMLIGQELAWNEQRVILKYSFRRTDYAKYRPELLGKNFQENMFKDYNGQTYWLSVNPSSFMNNNSRFPKWLNVAVGYGASGMLGGVTNPFIADEKGNPVSFERYRQYYLSLDVDLTRIKTKSKFLTALFKTVNCLKFPAPAIEFNKNGVNALLFGF